MRISFSRMQEVLAGLFLKKGFTEKKADLLARTFSESSLYGVNSHGINRVALFCTYIDQGLVNVEAEAVRVEALGNMERWDGRYGPGIINAGLCTVRAIELAKVHGTGLVALRNTNHWLRGGSYGLQAARAGCMAIMFTNTKPNMPPWGASESRIGNNPLVIALPSEQRPVLLDMAISQFSFGKIHAYKLRGEKLPFPGGWDENDLLSDAPEKILLRERGLPIGYWKGSALSMVLDMLATLLSLGDSTAKIGERGFETGISQVFLCIDPGSDKDRELQEKLLREIIDYTHGAQPLESAGRTYYPGEQSAMTREMNLKKGIPVDDDIWEEILRLSE